MISIRRFIFRELIKPIAFMMFLIILLMMIVRTIQFKESYENRIDNTFNLISLALEYGLTISSYEEINSVLTKAIISRPDIDKIIVFNELNEKLSEINNESYEYYYLVSILANAITGNKDGIIVDNRDVFLDINEDSFSSEKIRRKIGYLQIHYDIKPLIMLDYFGLMILILSTFVIFILVSVYSTLIAKKISNPISDLNHGLDEFSSKMRKESVKEYKIVEINELSKKIGLMTYKITDYQKNLEKKIQDATNELVLKNTELNKKNNEVMLANQAKTQFLSNVSHELKTPLSGIRLLCSSIEQELKSGHEQVAIRHVGRINVLQQELLSLINEILHFSEIDSDSVKLKYSMSNPNLFIKRIIGNVCSLAFGKSISIYCYSTLDEKSLYMIDERQLERVISNIIINAIKYTHNGSVYIFIGFNSDSKRLEFVVKDTGIGIKNTDFSLIFKPFLQSDSSDTRVFDGTGLGLSISKNLIDKMGGEITVNSVVGIGSEFSVFVPVSKYTEGKTEFIHNNVKIGILSNNSFCIDSISGNLEKIGFSNIKVIRFNNDELQDYDVDVIIGDENNLNESNVYYIRSKKPDVYIIKLSNVYDIQRTKSETCDGINEYWPTFIMSDEIKIDHKNSKSTSLKINDIINYNNPSYGGKLNAIKLLLVEDNIMLQDIYYSALKKEGAYVDVSNNGKECLDKVNNNIYDCIIMDLQMPIMSGEEAALYIKQNYKNSPPIICLTASHLSGEKITRMQHLFDEIVYKNDDIEILFNKIISLKGKIIKDR